MVPPEGGYQDPRTTGRGGPSARWPADGLQPPPWRRDCAAQSRAGV